MLPILLSVILMALPTITSAVESRVSLEDDTWHMLSIPGASATTLREVFSTALPVDDYETTWMSFRFDDESQAYAAVGLDEPLEPDTGFWLLHRSGETVEIQFSGNLSTDAIEKPLGAVDDSLDFHLLGVPTAGPSSVSDIQVFSDGPSSACRAGCTLDTAAESGYIQSDLIRYDSDAGRYVTLGAEARLDAWQGFWLVALEQPQAGSLSVLFSPTGAPTGPPVDNGGGGGAQAGTFACLDRPQDLVTVDGVVTERHQPDTEGGRVFDARRAQFYTDNVRWGTIDLQGDDSEKGMCWAGGEVHSTRPYDASWLDHKAVADPNDPSRNSAAIANRSVDAKVTGLYAFNVSDAFRTSDAKNWRVEHSWVQYVRDDGIENDRLQSGTIYDTLFDGVYTAFSTRPDTPDTDVDGRNSLMTIDKVLARLQAQPYPYKWQEDRGAIDVSGESYSGNGMPYGHGLLFKHEEGNGPGRNIRFAIRDSVFLAEHYTTDKDFDFPEDALIEECSNVSVIWLGPGEYPGRLPDSKFPNCVKVVTGQAGRDLWKQKVTDWHARHPNVGVDHKPANPGQIEFPQVF